MSPARFIFSLITAQLIISAQVATAWIPTALVSPRTVSTFSPTALLLNENDIKEDSENTDRTSFDQAGASLVDEEDRKRMEQMGDFDSNDSYQDDSIERMRAAIRQRTAGLGIERSKVTADYIAQRERAAKEAGPPGVAAQNNPNTFGGLDLSQISQVKQTTSDWDEDLPSMLYNPEDDLSKEEQEEVDPVMLQNPLDQGLSELANTKWPTPLGALREVVIMIFVIALSTLIVVNWDSLLRQIYTSFGFIPSAEDIANYASRFDGLDLPQGWTDGMSDVDVQTYSDTVTTTTTSGMPEL